MMPGWVSWDNKLVRLILSWSYWGKVVWPWGPISVLLKRSETYLSSLFSSVGGHIFLITIFKMFYNFFALTKAFCVFLSCFLVTSIVLSGIAVHNQHAYYFQSLNILFKLWNNSNIEKLTESNTANTCALSLKVKHVNFFHCLRFLF